MIKYSLRFGLFVYKNSFFIRCAGEVFKFNMNISYKNLSLLIKKLYKLSSHEIDNLVVSNLSKETEFYIGRKEGDVYNLSFISSKTGDVIEYEIFEEEIKDFYISLKFIKGLLKKD